MVDEEVLKPDTGTLPDSPRKRAKARKQARAEQLVECATEVLVRDGYAQFSLRRVAADLDVRLGTVQYYFPSREALLTAALTRAFAAWTASFDEILAKVDWSPEARLFELQTVNLELQFNTASSPLLLELFAFSQHEPFIRRLMEASYLGHRRRIARLLAEIRPDIELDRLMEFATVLSAQWEGLSLFTLPGAPARPSLESLKDICGRTLAAFLTTLRDYSAAQVA